MSGTFLFIAITCLVASFLLPLGDAHRLEGRQRYGLQTQSMRLEVKVGIKDVARCKENLNFPGVIPMVFGNMIQGYRKFDEGFEVMHSRKETTELSPLRRKHTSEYGPNVAGFVFKESNGGAFPVPMENTIVVLRLMPVSDHFGNVHVWMIYSGCFTRKQMKKQKLFMLSLLQDFSDNIQRAFGVKNCKRHPTISGLCNNRANSVSGVTLQELLQEKGVQRQTTAKLNDRSPSARRVSNKLFKSKQGGPDAPKNTNMLMVIFGQFIDHEIVATTSERIDKESMAPISHSDNTRFMQFTRSGILRYDYAKCCNEEYSTRRVWEKPTFNTLTSFIDGGAVYGSNNFRANTLRSFKKGELVLKKKDGEWLLPINNGKDLLFKVHNEGPGSDHEHFVAGDTRANENPVLAAIHMLFAREHNRVCRLLRKWLRNRRQLRYVQNDNWLYKQARLIVIAELQSVVFNEYIPALLGKDVLGSYDGYDPSIDARITTFHSSFAYRWGHSAIAEKMNIIDRKGMVKTKALKDMFFRKAMFEEHGMGNIIKAAIQTPAKDIDAKVVESLRDFLFHPNEAGVLDLVSMNIQRARDLGVPGYLKVQEICKTGEGLDNIPEELRQPLLKVYESAEKIDPYVGGLSEEKVEGSLLGPLLHTINVEQFKRLRDGDRFYYENVNWHSAIEKMPLVGRIRGGKIRMKDIIAANTDIKEKYLRGIESAFKHSGGNSD